MPSLNEKLATSLSNLRAVTQNGQRRVLRGDELTRTDRERLIAQGFLQPIIKGWLMVSNPGDRVGDSTSWYASYWGFLSEYAREKFGDNWVVSPDASISLLAGNRTIPSQVSLQSPQAQNASLTLPHRTSIFAYKTSQPDFQTEVIDGVRVYPLVEALISAAPQTWRSQRDDVVSLIASLRNEGRVLGALLNKGNVAAAGRISGALRLLGREEMADRIIATMRRAGHDVREERDPFAAPIPFEVLGKRPALPIVNRIRLMWGEMRQAVLDEFPDEPKRINDHDAYIASINERYIADAYHSLSIEGYSVSEELIERVRNGKWDPDSNSDDRKQKDAMAAKGYWLAFQKVRSAIIRILSGENAARIVAAEHQQWYQEMFEPLVAAGWLKPEKLAGYRTHRVFISNSLYAPPASESVPDAMEAFLGCLANEPDPRVRAVLGHFVFTYIHPFPDGNGRSGRFIMNVMMASGGYQWTIIPVDRREDYMAALEAASTGKDIRPFARLVSNLSRLAPPPPRSRSSAEQESQMSRANPDT